MRSFADSEAADAVQYPSSDGKPMAETEIHLDNMLNVIASLRNYFRDADDVYVCGNMLMYYVQGDKHKHISPDVFVVRGIDKHIRDNYLVWAEGKAPDFVIEFTSSSTRNEDEEKKFKLYRDVLKVSEYFLFDPQEEYLSPSFQGYRLTRGRYAKIRLVNGRLPSEVLGLHLERAGAHLRIFDPSCGEWLTTLDEMVLARKNDKALLEKLAMERANDKAKLEELAMQRQTDKAELEHLRQQLKILKGEKE